MKRGWKVDLSGQRFGRITVIKFHGNINNRRFFDCICDCGVEKTIPGANLTGGITESCGCLKRDRAREYQLSHGEASKIGITKEYRTWRRIKNRCNNPKDIQFSDYGGRGIKVCQRWTDSYTDFLSDMGRAPSAKHSIERVNVNGNYEPKNCKWATQTEQMNNRQDSKRYAFNGKSQTLPEWCRELGLPQKNTYQRIHKLKWPIERALTA